MRFRYAYWMALSPRSSSSCRYAFGSKNGILLCLRPILCRRWLTEVQTIAGVLCCLQLATLVLWALPTILRTRTSIAAAALSLIDSGIIAVLLYLEHRRSIGPSKILSGYLFVTILLDVAQARTLFRRSDLRAMAGIFTASLISKSTLLFLEEVPKRSLLAPKLRETTSLEKTSGLLNRTVFWWLNGLFRKGFGGLLSLGDLSIIHTKFASRSLQAGVGQAWHECKPSRLFCFIL